MRRTRKIKRYNRNILKSPLSCMKLHQDLISGTNLITAHGPGFVSINGQVKGQGLVVTPELLIEPWCELGFDSLDEAAVSALAKLGATITLIGTGKRQRFPAPALLRPLIESRRGFEIMDTAAACRTYNILVGEGRSVAAALIVEP